MMPYLPLGTLYAAAFLKSKNYEVELFDSMLEDSEENIFFHLQKFKPKYLVIYDDDFNYLTKMCLERMRLAAFKMSEIGKKFGCIVIIHSSDSADNIEKYIENKVDYVIFGEGEDTLLEAIEFLEKKSTKKLNEIDGIAFKENNIIVKNQKRKVKINIDDFPFPLREIANLNLYKEQWIKKYKYFSMNIVTTRGCPFHCNWCAKPIYGQVYNSRSPKNVVEEIKFLKEKYEPNHIWFCDDIFGLKPNWVQEFSEIIEKENAKIPFKCLSRADLLLKNNTIDALHKSGCDSVWIGAESGSQKILDAMEKGITVEQIYEATKKLKEKKIKVGFFLQFGYLGETKNDIEKTFEMVKNCMPNEIGVSVSYPLPNTKFYDIVKEEMQTQKNWFDSQDLAMMFHGTYETRYYRHLHKLIHKKFRVWKGVQNFVSFRNALSMIYHFVTIPNAVRKLNKFGQKK